MNNSITKFILAGHKKNNYIKYLSTRDKDESSSHSDEKENPSLLLNESQMNSFLNKGHEKLRFTDNS